MDFEAASESLDGGIHVVSVTGEIDLATGPELERALLALPDEGVASVVVDLTGCSFMDSTGLHLLVRTQRRCDRPGGRLAVVSANRSVLKVFEITRLDQLFAIYPSRTAALNGDGDH
jgi:anti-sigma B factor antagonist